MVNLSKIINKYCEIFKPAIYKREDILMTTLDKDSENQNDKTPLESKDSLDNTDLGNVVKNQAQELKELKQEIEELKKEITDVSELLNDAVETIQLMDKSFLIQVCYLSIIVFSFIFMLN